MGESAIVLGFDFVALYNEIADTPWRGSVVLLVLMRSSGVLFDF